MSRGGGGRERLRGTTMQDDIRFASAGDDIKIWDSSSMTVVEQFNPHSTTHPVSSLCWSSNNLFLVTASGSGDKIVVSSCKSKPVPLLELAEGKKQTCVNLNSSSQYMVSGGLDNTVNIWDLKSKRLHRSLKDHKDEITSVTFNGNDSYIASGSMSGEIVLHNVTTNLSSAPFGHGSNQPIRHLKYSYIKKFLLGAASDSGSVMLWDAHSQNPVHMFDSAHKAPASGISFSPVNDLLLVTIGLDKRIICYDVSRKILLQTVVTDSPLTAVDFMPDGATLAVGTSRGKIYLYDLRMLNSPIKSVNAHKTSVQCIQFQHSSTHKSSKSSNKPSLVSANVAKKAPTKSTYTVKDLPASLAAPALTQAAVTVDSRGLEMNNAKPGIPHSTSLDVIPSKETDIAKTSDLKSVDSFGRSSLGDIFSPVREDALHLRVMEEFASKGNDLDYLAQFSAIPSRRHPAGSNNQGIHSSPLHLIIGSPIKEEDESQDAEYKSRKPYIVKPDLKENIVKQPLKPASSEQIAINTSPVPISRTPDASERMGKQAPSQLKQDFSFNGKKVLSPKMSNSVSSEVACSLSEKIADSLASEKSGAPLTSVQINFIRNMIEETLDDFREACHRDIINLQVEMIKQFHIQSSEIQTLIDRYSVNENLVAEIEKLREENKRLKAHY
ncbi:protein NEDD1 isoform X1 [Bufo gargarizans]|uniref:protein NEDD1 isoform X1 n=2 Tax=Bufo gargarizans TaxID=30331 RepID=UPI001CF38964|nr:protein NEDD1 isoform X1 [Bufo gargarizans]